jgi:succinyl-diaminopimelate desuccinylase
MSSSYWTIRSTAEPATAGFGVAYEGLHGPDKRVRIDSIPPVQAPYRQVLLPLLPAA